VPTTSATNAFLAEAFLPGPQQCAELGDGDGGDGDVVLVGNHLVQAPPGTVGVDEERRVEQEPGQGRSSISTSRRKYT
jgi:hypothetical protein